MKKKLSNYLLYPIVLGTVCLVAGGTLAAVNYVTSPTIKQNAEKKANEAIFKIAGKLNKEVDTSEDAPVVVENEAQKSMILVKKNVSMKDSSKYKYYKLVTPKGYSGTITFGCMVNEEFKVVGVEYIESTEDSIGVSAFKKITISEANPFEEDGEVTSSASAGKTLPAVGKALNAAIADAKKDSGVVEIKFPTEGTFKEQLQFMYQYDLGQEGEVVYEDITETAKAIDISNTTKSKVEARYSFTYNGEKAHFYVISFVQREISGDIDPGKFAAIVNSKGIIDYQFISASGMLEGTMNSKLKGKITPENPFTADTNFGVFTGATTGISNDVMSSAFLYMIGDYKGDNKVEFPRKGTVEEQFQYMWEYDLGQVGTVSYVDVTPTDPSITITNTSTAKVNAKYNFKLNDADASFYVISFTQIDIEGDIDDGKFAAIANASGIIDYQFISGGGMLAGAMKAFNGKASIDNPYTVDANFDVITGSTTTISNQLMKSALNYVISDFNSSLVPDFPKKGSSEDQLKHMWKYDLKQSGEVTYEDITSSASAISIDKTTHSKVVARYSFTYNGSKAFFYVISFTQIDIDGDVDDGKFAAIVNASGVIDYQFISGGGMLAGSMKALNGKISPENPYVADSNFGVITGATTHISNQLMHSAMIYMINDFGGEN